VIGAERRWAVQSVVELGLLSISTGWSQESRLPFLDYGPARFAGGDTAGAGLIFSWISIEIWFPVFIDGEGTAACGP
jgi:hypothetical protein